MVGALRSYAEGTTALGTYAYTRTNAGLHASTVPKQRRDRFPASHHDCRWRGSRQMHIRPPTAT